MAKAYIASARCWATTITPTVRSCHKLLTGFDAPSCTYLYIDKSMQDHGLFQAICRTNRLDGEDKDFGYVVDYKDLFKKVENAIAVYSSELDHSAGGPDPEVLLQDRLKKGREVRLSVKVRGFFVQQMKTKWGSCNPATGTIRLNTELAKKPTQCLEYIVVHEMVHLLEATHSPRFLAIMDRVSPSWRSTRDVLNRLPARHQRWNY